MNFPSEFQWLALVLEDLCRPGCRCPRSCHSLFSLLQHFRVSRLPSARVMRGRFSLYEDLTRNRSLACEATKRDGPRKPRAELRTEDRGPSTPGSRSRLAGVRTEIASSETRLIRWMVGTVLATGGLTLAAAGRRGLPEEPPRPCLSDPANPR